MKHSILYILLVTLIATSCSSTKDNLTYFQDLSAPSGIIEGDKFDIKIVPDDELLITISSLVPEATAAYNMPLNNPSTRGNVSTQNSPSVLTYIVNSKGNVTLPVLGDIHVAGLSTDEVTNLIKAKVSENVKDPSVRVQLYNFKVNVLGEVKTPGIVSITGERFTILDALASVGDLTEYGKREDVLLIREENGVKTYHRINLNDAKVISSPYYYLKQNDVVYVEPNKIRKDNSKYNQNNAFKLSVVSTIVSAASIIASLVIALTVK